MITVLLIADLHGQYGMINSYLELDADMIIFAGDFTDCGSLEPLHEMLRRIKIPFFAVPGNCDSPEILSLLDNSPVVNLHGHSIDIDKLTLTGIGGSNPTPFGTPFELKEEEIGRILNDTSARETKNIHNVLVSHFPPLLTLDRVGDMNVGSSALREHISGYDLVCCAHIHEQKGICETEGVKIVNPGPASEGNYALITLGEKKGEITIELKKLCH